MIYQDKLRSEYILRSASRHLNGDYNSSMGRRCGVVEWDWVSSALHGGLRPVPGQGRDGLLRPQISQKPKCTNTSVQALCNCSIANQKIEAIVLPQLFYSSHPNDYRLTVPQTKVGIQVKELHYVDKAIPELPTALERVQFCILSWGLKFAGTALGGL